MDKQIVGEWILQQLMTPDRAAAIVGDLEQNGVSPAQFWLAVASNILHAINPAVLGASVRGCLAQFVFALPLGAVTAFAFFFLPRMQSPILFLWVARAWILGAQILTGFWLARTEKQPLLICMLIVLADCMLGLLCFNNASLNMSIWAIPLLVATVAFERRHRRKSVA